MSSGGYRGGGGNGVNINGGIGEQNLVTLPFWLVLQGAKAMTPDAGSAARRAYSINEEGIAAYNAQDYAKAAELFREASSLSPDDAVMANNVKIADDAVAREQQTEDESAPADQQQSDPQADALNDQAVEAWKAGNTLLAENMFRQAAERAPNDSLIAENLRAAVAANQNKGLPAQPATMTGGGTPMFGHGANGDPAAMNVDLASAPATNKYKSKSTAEELARAKASGKLAKSASTDEKAKALSNCSFDGPSCAQAALHDKVVYPDKNRPQTPGAITLASHIPPAAKKDKGVRDMFAFYQKLDGRKLEAERKLSELEKQGDNSLDPSVFEAKKATLTKDLKRYTADQKNAETQIKKRVKNLGLAWNESSKSADARVNTQ
jgi:tetratricopeptide (TPR) repeat protein